MLKHRLTHPQILEALAAAGHGSRVLIADGNYPSSTTLGENAEIVFLNLAPGRCSVTEVLKVLLTAIEVEEAAVMLPDDGAHVPVFDEFSALLPGHDLVKYDRFTFYEEASGPDTCLVIATGEQRVYANLLLTLGVVAPGL